MSVSLKGVAVVTGASAGIGAVYADRLVRRGYDLILVARNRRRLASLARRLTNETGRKVETVEADLTSPADLQRVEDILRTDAAISVLVNNAGVGASAPLVASDVDKMEDMIRLNVTALTRLTYAAVPGFVARGSGTIINISSVVAIAPEVLNVVYGGSKAFVLAFSQSLLHELADKGIRVQAVLPGATATEFWDVAGTPVHQLPPQIVMSADDLVDAALAGLDLGETVTVPSLADKAVWDRHEAARLAMTDKLSSAIPAPRYNLHRHESASARRQRTITAHQSR
ncbi:SDR family oxidoreductase [Bradyrhizobium sp. WSM 1738]|uniref:SDR family NAD(P)-dependent oxidoreductase n=1 Tax=Bradyrhizobium hereditatis TaxID=2821405 RepID=UPI001CE336CD|nr:SDR family oxidoreductase [Bradyrhizobium hereditatis]MCA6117330.1 SDR family oxidoreductase [Bradyrhizobium hereditatis]